MRPLRIEVSDELPWREYIASHASYDSLIGTGVEDFFLQFRKKAIQTEVENLGWTSS